MAALGTEQKRAQAALQFLRTSFNPIANNTAPPIPTSSRSDILKDVTIQCQFAVQSISLINENIPQTNGMILWLMKRGLGSIYRMAFVPAGAISNVTTSGPLGLVSANLNITRPYSGSSYIAGKTAPDGYGIINTIQYLSELALPVGVQNGISNTIQITPNAAGQFEYSRVYAGIFESYSSTVSIGNTALSGTFSAASISDTRNVCQSPQGAFSITNIVQSSETTKDAVMQVPSDHGVVALVGPDIQDNFESPSQEQAVIVNGTFTNYSVPQSGPSLSVTFNWGNEIGSSVTTNYPPFDPQLYPMCNVWVSPWNTVVTTRILTGPVNDTSPCFPSDSANVVGIQIPQISETGIPSFRFNCNCAMQPDPGTGLQQGTLESIAIAATHIFATANLDGSIQYKTFIERKVLYTGWVLNWNELSMIASLDVDPKLYFTSFTNTGKFIGTLFSVYCVPLQARNSTQIDATPAVIQNISITVINQDSCVDGNNGPARIVRWDAMSAGMTIDVAGKLWAQVIPSASLMPFVKAQQMNRTRFVPENAERLLKSVYNSSSTLLRRVWNLKAYKQFLAGAAKDISQETIVDWSRTDETVEDAAYAAGMFASTRVRDRS